MTRVQSNQISDTMVVLKNFANQAIAERSPDRFGLVESKINELDSACREMMQELWKHEAEEAIDAGKLEQQRAETGA